VRVTLLAILAAVAACHRVKAPAPAADDNAQRSAMRAPAPKAEPVNARPLLRCFPEDASGDAPPAPPAPIRRAR
jgi:hypothetical protein